MKSKLQIADELYSRLRRLQESEDGFCTCISCGRRVRWQYITIGHYIKRRHLILRYDNINTQPQCKFCNQEQENDKEIEIAFGRNLIVKYGMNILNILGQMKRTHIKYSSKDYEEMIKKFRKNIKEYEKSRI